MVTKKSVKDSAKESKASKGSKALGRQIFGLSTTPWLDQKPEASTTTSSKKNNNTSKSTNSNNTTTEIHGRLIVVSSNKASTLNADTLRAAIKQADAIDDWQWERAARRRGEVALTLTATGPLWLVQLNAPKAASSHAGLLDVSPYGQARDLAGQAAIMALDYGLATLQVESIDLTEEEQRGVAIGLELATYRFKNVTQPESVQRRRPALQLVDFDIDVAREAALLGVATNMARHLVNTPPADLNPTTYAAALTALFAGSKTMSVEVWQGRKLEQERCHLLLAVGRAAPEKAALVRLSYRPKGKTRFAKPLALVGKGVTFDTGGIDLKDADSMRLMKKDMGGSASLAGLALYLETAAVDVACDIYLALAENSMDGEAFRPSDILKSRGGHTVEIHNTDAEGRLVLADAIDVAITRQGADAPLALIDLATLTGAMRIALGTRIGGLFANDDHLADDLLQAGQRAGDPSWRMPLVKEYNVQLKTVFADIANAAPGRFGGAITAALFLQRFVGNIRWAHIDLYTWSEGSQGAIAESGGNGQGVQGLAQFLRDVKRL